MENSCAQTQDDPSLERVLRDMALVREGMQEEAKELGAIACRLEGPMKDESDSGAEGMPALTDSYVERLRREHAEMAYLLTQIRDARRHMERAV